MVSKLHSLVDVYIYTSYVAIYVNICTYKVLVAASY